MAVGTCSWKLEGLFHGERVAEFYRLCRVSGRVVLTADALLLFQRCSICRAYVLPFSAKTTVCSATDISTSPQKTIPFHDDSYSKIDTTSLLETA
jgi:hypothetical protein